MNCLSCFSSQDNNNNKKATSKRQNSSRRKGHTSPIHPHPNPAPESAKNGNGPKDIGNKNIAAQTFTFRELATATKNFRQECLIGEGGFGRVYKGKLEKTGQVIKGFLLHFSTVLLYASHDSYRVTFIFRL